MPLSSFLYTDDVDDVMAAHMNRVTASTLRGELGQAVSITTQTALTDGDFPYLKLTPNANLDVLLAPEAITNHVQVIENGSGTYTLTVKDDSDTTTIASIGPNDIAMFIPSLGTAWSLLTIGGGSTGLTNTAISPTTSNVTAAVGKRYVADLSGLTSNRNFVLPTGTDGDEIEITIRVGDDAYALILIGDTGVTINGGSAATEWSRLFISGETVRFVATSGTNWQVIDDGRRPCIGIAERQAAQSINSASATKIALDAEVVDRGDVVDVATNDRINIRRAGVYKIDVFGSMSTVMDDQEQLQVYIYVDGVQVRAGQLWVSAGVANQYTHVNAGVLKSLTVGQYVELYFYHTEGAAQNTDTTYVPSLTVMEVL